MSAWCAKGLVSAIVVVVGVGLVFMPLFVPVTWWVTVVPGIIMVVFQAFAWSEYQGLFIAGDFAYYLAIGGVLGLATIVVDNSEEISLIFANNETRALAQSVRRTEADFQNTSSDLDAINRSIQSAERQFIETADDPAPPVDTDLLAACLANQMFQDVTRDFESDWEGQLLEIPRLDSFVDPCAWIANPRRPADIAQDRRSQFVGRKSELEAQYVNDKQALDVARAEFESSRGVWFAIDDDQRRKLLFELFPCLLLIGVATKLGKVANSIKT